MATTNQRNSSSNLFDNSSSKNALNVIAFRYLPFWPIFVITIFTSLLISFIYIHYQTPIFEANATILLKDQKSGATDANVLEALGVTSNSAKTVENEIEVLKSRTLVREVAREMGLYAQVYSKGTLRDIMVYPNPVKFIALNPDQLLNSPNVPISFKYIAQNYVVIGKIKYPLKVPVTTPYGQFIIQPTAEIERYSESSAKENYYLQIRSVKAAGNAILGALSVALAAKQSSLIGLKLADQVPARAEDVLNSLIHVYNKAGIDDKNKTVANTLDFINNRLVTVTKDLTDVEGNLQQYKSAQGIVSLPDQGKLYLDNVQTKDQSLSQITVQLDVLNEIEKYIQKKADNPGIVPATLGVTDIVLNNLLEKLYTAELTLESQRQVSGENSPAIAALQAQITQLKSSLLENIRSQRVNLIASQNSLQSQINQTSGMLKKVPQRERELLEITRQQSIKNAIYTFLLQKREDAEISYASAVADSRVVNYAESGGSPIKPIAINIYLIGLAIGLFLGVAFVLIREQFNREVLFRSDIEKETGATVLAEIMHDDSGEALVIKDGKRTVIAEQLRALRTSLNYIGLHGERKVILLTSSISGEGKSFMGVNMSVSLSLTGKKVVLLEFDLRKPKVSKMLDIQQQPGISEYLAGLASYEDIQRSMEAKKIPNLCILPAGAIPPNPTELMLNGKLDTLVDQLKRDFDYILIDSPPVGLVTDAKILDKYSDACLYMVRHNYTPKHFLGLVEQLYVNRELTNINIVFNGLKSRGVLKGGAGYGSSYGYGYSYGGGYGYGYTQDDIKQKKLKGKLKVKSKKQYRINF